MEFLVIKWIHVLAAITAVGANITYAMWIARAAREPDVLPFVLRTISTIDRRLANPNYAVLLLTGSLMALQIRIPFTTPWLLTALVLYFLAALLGIVLYAPTARQQRQILETEGFDSPNYKSVARRATWLGIVVTVDVIVIVFLMVMKPMLWA
jgi:uncharacterized membrane protein